MVMFEDRQIKWSLLLIRTLQALLSVVIVLAVWRYHTSLNPYFSATLIFSGIVSIVLIFVLASVEKGVHYKIHYSWNGLRCVAILGLFTPAMPLAILSLREVFNSKVTRDFYNTKTIYSERKLSPVTKFSGVMVLLLCLLGGTLYMRYQKNSAFLDVAFKETNYSLPPKSSVKELYEIAGECNAYGKTKCALTAFLQILKQSPGDVKALANLAMTQSHLGQHSFAVENFKRVVDKGYETYDVYFFYGKSLEKIRQKDAARKAYLHSLQLNPEFADAAAGVALILVEQEKFGEALEFIQSYLKKNPAAQKRFRAVQENLKAKIQDV